MISKLNSVNFKGKRTLVRVDFNVPFNMDGSISDTTRIDAVLPTIKYLIEYEARVVLVSHLGRPKGVVNLDYSLKPVAKVLGERLGQPVTFLSDCIGAQVDLVVSEMMPGSVVLLENVRFHTGEETNDPVFAEALAGPFDVFVNDAFGTAHRAHASTAGVVPFMKECAAGFLIEKEVEYLNNTVNDPKRPFLVILGGAKVSDKIEVIESLIKKADTMLIGGAMAYTFALAHGHRVGESLCEPEKVKLAKRCLELAKERGIPLMTPVDTLITNKFDFGKREVGSIKVVEGDIPDGWEGVDIGPETVKLYQAEIKKAQTIFWNGPMGVFEIEACSKGTFAMADAIANSDATSIIGGGDSVKAINASGNGGKVTFMSTGGGASLEFLQGKELPGIAALKIEETTKA